MVNVSYKVVDNTIDMEVSEHGVVLYKNKISQTKKMMYVTIYNWSSGISKIKRTLL